MSRVFALLAVFVACGCAGLGTQTTPADANTPEFKPDTPNKIDNELIARIAFPVNLIPDVASNTFIYFFNPLFNIPSGVSNLWPIITILSPVGGTLGGTMDAWYGYPFWNPVALDEHRQY